MLKNHLFIHKLDLQSQLQDIIGMDKNHLHLYKKMPKSHWSTLKLVLQLQLPDITGTDKNLLLSIRNKLVLDF